MGLAGWFTPDQNGLGAWARRTFIDEGGALTNERHAHLRSAEIGWLWTTAAARDRNRTIAGECRLISTPQSKWSSAMAAFQLEQWFGFLPDFLITLDVSITTDCDDWAFCALIEHELCHAAQDIDIYEMPKFTKEGLPVFRIIAHDVEEFTDVVARYGADATGVRDMVTAANKGPSIGAAQMSMACGTCRAKRRA